MPLHRVLSPILLVGVSLPFILGYSAIQSKSASTDNGTCSVTISGREKPDRVPTQEVWEATFRRLSTPAATGLQLNVQTSARLSAIGATTLDRANSLRASLSGAAPAGLPRQAAHDRDLVVADTILDARDNVLRDLSDEENEQLVALAEETAKTVTFTLPLAGRVIHDDSGAQLCRVDVLGREFPNLVPEYQVWRFMFDAWSRAVDYNIQQHGSLTEDYLRLLSRSVFKGMPAPDIQSFLLQAKATTLTIEQLERTPPSGRIDSSVPFELAVQRLVLSGRRRVLRDVTVEGWRALLNYVDSYGGGVKAWYTEPLGQ